MLGLHGQIAHHPACARPVAVQCGAQPHRWPCRLRAAAQQAGPQTPEPSYTDIDAQPLNRVVMALFRRKMVDALGTDSTMQGYVGCHQLTQTKQQQQQPGIIG